MTTSPLIAIMVISLGASIGASLRWGIGLLLNAHLPHFALGTLLANLMGSYLMGLCLAVFALYPSYSAEWRLLLMTGFLGSLTTFSTFSAEVVTLMQQERWLWAGATLFSHVLGCLLLTFLGMLTISLVRRLF